VLGSQCARLPNRVRHFGHQFSQIGLLHNLGLNYLRSASFVSGLNENSGNAFLKGLADIAHNASTFWSLRKAWQLRLS
jgi:hypothetical protein